MKRLALLSFLLLLMFMSLPQLGFGQGTPSEGKDYYLGYINPTFNKVVPARTAGYYRVYALISSFQKNTVYISYFDPVTGVETAAQPYQVPAKGTLQYMLDVSSMAFPDDGPNLASDKKGYRSCHITSKKPINVQFFNTGASACGSYLALPTNALGKNYVIQTWYDNPDGDLSMIGGAGPLSIDKACGIFEIIGTFNGTTVEIIPTTTTQGGKNPGVHKGPGATGVAVPYTISLNRGECYIVKSWCSDNEKDISATTIRADKPVFVIAGHENAALGGVGEVNGRPRPLEGRDFMIESMIPCEYWDTTGYVTAPLVDSSPTADDGVGETYRVFTCDSNGAIVHVNKSGFSGSTELNLGLHQDPPNLFDIVQPMHFFSPNGKKFAVMSYDNRNQSLKEPFPAPAMMSIVPRSRWRNAYLWFVPSNVNEKLQGYYANVFGPVNSQEFDKIMVSKDGGAEKKITSAMGIVGSAIGTIPNHPDLRVTKFKLSPGSYYAHATFPFMVYHYGFRAVDSDGDLGDFDNDDNFFAYGLPVGMLLSAGIPPELTVEIDTFCAKWHVKVTDHRQGGGIKSALLLDDIQGDIVIPTDSMLAKGVTGYQYFNTAFDPISDPAGNREISFTGNDPVVEFDVLISDVSKDGYAPLYIIDNAGNPILVELRFKKASVKYVPDDSLSFGLLGIGKDSNGVLMFINLGTNSRPYSLLKAELKNNEPGFTIDSVIPPIGSSIQPGDTLRVYTSFTAIDTAEHRDSVIIKTDCFENLIPLVGRGGTPLILAGDIDFGTIVVGSKKCTTTTVKNVGNMPFLLTKGVLADLFGIFSISQSTLDELALNRILKPGESMTVRLCYEPKQVGTDSSYNTWGTDITPPYEHSIDDVTKLIGRAIKPGVEWDRQKQHMRVLCDSYDTVRVNLVNTSTAAVNVQTVYWSGPDKLDFKVINAEVTLSPLGNFVLEVGDSVWMDVQFHAIDPLNTGLRVANLEAIPDITGDNKPRVINFTGEVTRGIAQILVAGIPEDSIKLGANQVSIPVPIGFVIKNTGDSTLYINMADLCEPEVKFEPALTFPIIIKKGEEMPFSGTVTLNQYIDTTFNLNFISNSPCSPKAPLFVQIAASLKNVEPLGSDAPPTYVVCRQSKQYVYLTNRGTIPVKLNQVEIYDGLPPYTNANQFQFATSGTQTTNTGMPRTIAAGATDSIEVIFKPQIEGALAARVRFIYDYFDAVNNKTVVDTAISGKSVVTGPGVLLRNVFSAKNAAGVPFTQKTGDVFDLPIVITDPIELNAGVYGAKFTLTYRGDLFDYIKVTGAGGMTATLISKNHDVVTGFETANFEVTSTTPMETGMKLADISFQVMVAKENKSDFVVTNGVFMDAAKVELCYFVNQHIPGEFVPEYLCGDPSLKDYLSNGTVTTRIAPMSPNPVTPGTTPKLVYRIATDNTPVTIEMYDVLGNKVRTIESQTTKVAGEHSNLISTKSLAPGAYTIRITTPTSDVTTSFVLTK